MIASAPDCPCTPARAGGATVGRGRRAIDGAGSDCSQAALVAAVAKAAAAPITVLVTGSSVDLTPIKANPKVGAILWRGYSGEAAGQATADVIFGTACSPLASHCPPPASLRPRRCHACRPSNWSRPTRLTLAFTPRPTGTHNPSGRLTSTFYPADFVNAWKPGLDPYTGGISPPANASYFDHSLRPNATTGNPGRTHRFCKICTALQSRRCPSGESPCCMLAKTSKTAKDNYMDRWVADAGATPPGKPTA